MFRGENGRILPDFFTPDDFFSETVQNFIADLKKYFAENEGKEPKVFFQDESYTSVTAEEYLHPNRKDRKEGKVDEEAAAIILQDFLERSDLAQIEQEITND